jgi:hypothetical protein
MSRFGFTLVALGWFAVAAASARADDVGFVDLVDDQAPIDLLDALRTPVESPAGGWPWSRRSGLAPVDVPHADESKEPPPSGSDVHLTYPYPRFRLEAYMRVTAGYRGRIKQGRNRIANTWEPEHDAHIPQVPVPGYRFIFDARLVKRISLGVHYTRLWVDGPKRPIHHSGIGVQATKFPGNTRVETKIDLQVGEFFARYVVLDSPRARLAVGTGAAWASHRVHLVSDTQNASERVEAFFLPTITYWFSLQLVPAVSFFFESMSGFVSPWRFPSVVSEFRIGFRWHFGPHVELVTAVGSSWGMMHTLDEIFGGKPKSPGKRWDRAEWSAMGGELGLAITF